MSATSRSGLPAFWLAGFPVGSREADRAVRSFAAVAWSGLPDPHARQDVDASSVTPAFGEPAETKKARYVVALSRVLRSTRDLPRQFALGQFATTGTCEFGQADTYARIISDSRIFVGWGRKKSART